MRQTVTILCALIAALLVASGLIVAGGVERMAQLEEQSGLIAQLQRQLDASGTENETLQKELEELTLEREALQKQVDEANLALEDAGALQRTMERTRVAFRLGAAQAENETLSLRLDAVTKERDEAMANAEALERRLAEAQRAAQEGMADADAVNAVDAGALEDADGNARPDRENSAPALPVYPLRNGPSLLLK